VTTQQRVVAAIVSESIFLCVLLVSALLLYYTALNLQGNPGDDLTNALRWLLEHQSTATDVARVVLVALPALAIAACVHREGLLRPFGYVAIATLVPTLLLSGAATILLDPRFDSPGSKELAHLADATARQLAGFSLTYLSTLLGLRVFGVDN
jgi:hypothetical protein